MNKLRLLCAVFVLLSALLLFAACGGGTGDPTAEPSGHTGQSEERLEKGGFEVYTMSVGKADCMVLKTEKHAMVIDLGVKEKAEDEICFIAAHCSSVDALLISHYDKDHIGAIKKFTARYAPGAIYLPEYEDEKPENAEDVRYYLDKHGYIGTVVTKETSFSFDGVDFTVYPTDIFFKRNDKGSNESSLVVTAKHGDNLFLFAGDAEGRRLPEITEQLPDPSAVDYLKVPHHGVYDAGSEAFFTALSPQYAVICCSEAEPADGSTVRLLENVGAQIFLSTGGNVKAVSDGTRISVYYE